MYEEKKHIHATSGAPTPPLKTLPFSYILITISIKTHKITLILNSYPPVLELSFITIL